MTTESPLDVRLKLMSLSEDIFPVGDRHETQVEVDKKGHEAYWDRFMAYSMTSHLSSEDASRLHDAWDSRTPLEDPLAVSFTHFDHQTCGRCKNGEYLTDGFKFWAKEECPLKDGIPVKVRLEVPSGKLVVGNDFRRWFDHGIDEDARYEEFSVNYSYGIAAVVKAYAEHGSMLHFFVGNSSPGVYPTGEPNEFVIANPDWDVDANEEGEYLNGNKQLGSVCTDLWWVSIVDHDEAVKRGMEIKTGGWADDFIIEVEPGTYELDYQMLLASHEHYPRKGDEIFATLKRVG